MQAVKEMICWPHCIIMNHLLQDFDGNNNRMLIFAGLFSIHQQQLLSFHSLIFSLAFKLYMKDRKSDPVPFGILV